MAERQACNSHSQKAKGNLGSREGIFHQTVSKFPVANQVFLGSWMVDIFQEDHSLDHLPEGDTPEMVLSWYTWETERLDWGGN